MRLSHIFRYPVKGLSPESLNEVVLKPGAGLPLDRCFALTHGRSGFDFDQPRWIERRNFLVVAHCPPLAAATSHYDSDNEVVTIKRNDGAMVELKLNDSASQSALNDFFSEFIGDYQYGPYRIAKVPGTSLTDSPIQAVSLMNSASLRALESIAGVPLARQRFRGNLWFDSDAPWIEFDWIDKEIALGNVRFQIIDQIERCAAINASPETGKRDFDGLRMLQNNFGHRDFGVLAKVVEGGAVSLGNAITLV